MYLLSTSVVGRVLVRALVRIGDTYKGARRVYMKVLNLVLRRSANKNFIS
jgi:hypothetical protein